MAAPSSAWVIIAARGGDEAKSRLSGCLTAPERSRLAELMLQDMLGALQRCARVAGVCVTTPTAALAALAEQRGARVLRDDGASLNQAFSGARAALRQVQPDAAVVLLPGDLPLLEADDVDRLVGTLADAPATLVATRDGGTGAWALQAGVEAAPSFGADSARRHLAQVEGGLRADTTDFASLSCDIDTPEDLHALIQARGCSAEFVRLRRLAS